MKILVVCLAVFFAACTNQITETPTLDADNNPQTHTLYGKTTGINDVDRPDRYPISLTVAAIAIEKFDQIVDPQPTQITYSPINLNVSDAQAFTTSKANGVYTLELSPGKYRICTAFNHNIQKNASTIPVDGCLQDVIEISENKQLNISWGLGGLSSY